MRVVQAGDVANHHVVEVEVALCGGNLVQPWRDIEEVEPEGVPLPFVRTVVLVVDSGYVHEVGNFLIQGELAKTRCRHQCQCGKCSAEVVHEVPPNRICKSSPRCGQREFREK